MLSISNEDFQFFFFIVFNKFVENCDEKSQKSLYIISSILEECYSRSAATASIFNSEDGVNYYREAGLFCYWIRKLKPIVISSQDNDDDTLTRLVDVNETIAFFLASELICAAHLKIISDEYADKKLLKKSEDYKFHNNTMVAIGKMEKRLINSLRYHVYSIGSMPMLLESLFYIPLDEKYAYDTENSG